MYGGSEALGLRSGAIVRCSYDDAMVVTVTRAGHADQVARLPSPEAGLEGLELVVSPDERYACLFVYSGQSSQGWELFELEPTLRHVSSLPYVHGEGRAPTFSPDSRYLAMIVTRQPTERGTGKNAEKLLKPGATGEVLIDWAMLYAQRIPNEPVEESPVGTWVKRSMEAGELLGWDLYESLRFTGKHRLVLPLPWGGVLELGLPVGGPVTTANATSRPKSEY